MTLGFCHAVFFFSNLDLSWPAPHSLVGATVMKLAVDASGTGL